MPNPTIDVVMPVYNAAAYLGVAVQSILHQSYTDFRLLCIDDGSSDASPQILQEFAAQDSRIEIVRQENQGLIGALNVGISRCTAPLIARMDADDISMPSRFARQVDFLKKHPAVCAVGSSIVEIDSDSEPLAIQSYATEHQQIDSGMLQIKTGMAHPAVMMRRSVVQALGGYRDDFGWCEDLDLWLRMAEHKQLANLPEVLLCYRLHTASFSWQVDATRAQGLVALLKETYARRGLPLSEALCKRCLTRRSAGGPLKWARRAARQGQWQVASKHLRRQWHKTPLSLLTWRMTLEIAARLAVVRLLKSPTELPEVPCYHKAA